MTRDKKIKVLETLKSYHDKAMTLGCMNFDNLVEVKALLKSVYSANSWDNVGFTGEGEIIAALEAHLAEEVAAYAAMEASLQPQHLGLFPGFSPPCTDGKSPSGLYPECLFDASLGVSCPRDGDCREHGRNRPGQTVCAPVAPPPATIWDTIRSVWRTGRTLPADSATRKKFPIDSGHDAYFPAAIAAVAAWSMEANQKHNPGQPLQHARGKSADHRDCQARHKIDSADPSCDRLEELTCKAWRAYAELQEYAETLGAPPAPAATFPEGTRRTEAGWAK